MIKYQGIIEVNLEKVHSIWMLDKEMVEDWIDKVSRDYRLKGYKITGHFIDTKEEITNAAY